MNIFFTNKLFRIFLCSQMFGVIGRTLFDICFVIYASTFPNNKLAVSIVAIATSFPYIIDFILGYLADKESKKIDKILFNRKWQSILFLCFAFLTNFQANWFIFTIIIFINVIADMLAGYNGYLTMSVETKIVKSDELDTALAFYDSVMRTISLFGKTIGVFILKLLNYNYPFFGLLNSFVYFISFIMLYFYKNLLKETIGDFVVSVKKISIKNFFIETLENFKILKEIKEIYQFVILFAGMNLYSSGMYSVFLILLLNEKSLIFENYGYTIVLVETIEMVAMILGGIFQLPFYKKISLKSNVIVEIGFFILYVLNLMLFKNKVFLLVLVCISGYMSGISNPKLSAFLLKVVPEEKQTSIFSIYSTVVSFTVPIGTSVFIFLVNLLSVDIVVKILFLFLVILFIYSIIIKLRN